LRGPALLIASGVTLTIVLHRGILLICIAVLANVSTMANIVVIINAALISHAKNLAISTASHATSQAKNVTSMLRKATKNPIINTKTIKFKPNKPLTL